jgi:hypothetical protein
MNITSSLRKLGLTAHLISSLGWLGAVAAFLALALVGLGGLDAKQVRASYLAMDLTTRWVIVPLCFASVLTGVVQSLITPWGLIRHYWVIVKLAITVLATIILLAHVQRIDEMARFAAETVLSPDDHRGLRLQLVADAGAAVVALIVTTALGVYKPRGVTPYGWRKQRAASTGGA